MMPLPLLNHSCSTIQPAGRPVAWNYLVSCMCALSKDPGGQIQRNGLAGNFVRWLASWAAVQCASFLFL